MDFGWYLCFNNALSSLLFSLSAPLLISVILALILLVLLLLLLLLFLLGLLFLAEGDEIALVVLSSLVLSDGNYGGGARDDEGFWGNLARFQVLWGCTGTAGAVAKVPAVAVYASTHWGGHLSTFSIWKTRKEMDDELFGPNRYG